MASCSGSKPGQEDYWGVVDDIKWFLSFGKTSSHSCLHLSIGHTLTSSHPPRVSSGLSHLHTHLFSTHWMWAISRKAAQPRHHLLHTGWEQLPPKPAVPCFPARITHWLTSFQFLARPRGPWPMLWPLPAALISAPSLNLHSHPGLAISDCPLPSKQAKATSFIFCYHAHVQLDFPLSSEIATGYQQTSWLD